MFDTLIEHCRRNGRWLVPAVIIGGSVLYGAGTALWYRLVTARASNPAATDTCALGATDAAAFRALVARVTTEGASGGGNCRRRDDEAICFKSLMKQRLDQYAAQVGQGMEGRMLAMHALMRANKAALLSQQTLPVIPRTKIVGFTPDSRLRSEPDGPPLVQRAETFVYALDAREIGFSGPSLAGGGGSMPGERLRFDDGRTDYPSGSYAIAEVTMTLSDPALSYPADMATGAVEETFRYVEAAWSHRRPDKLTVADRRPLPAGSVHDLASLCPRRPAWLDVPAVRDPSGGGGAAVKRLFDRMRTMEAERARQP